MLIISNFKSFKNNFISLFSENFKRKFFFCNKKVFWFIVCWPWNCVTFEYLTQFLQTNLPKILEGLWKVYTILPSFTWMGKNFSSTFSQRRKLQKHETCLPIIDNQQTVLFFRSALEKLFYLQNCGLCPKNRQDFPRYHKTRQTLSS